MIPVNQIPKLFRVSIAVFTFYVTMHLKKETVPFIHDFFPKQIQFLIIFIVTLAVMTHINV